MAQPYKLSASLPGHDEDVRAVTFPEPSLVISASRDASVRLWRLKKGSPPRFEADISSHGSSFVNAVAFVPPSDKFPDGLVVSGGRDGILDVRSPKRAADHDADALLPAHESNVCALDVSSDGSYFVSGSWDTTACVWQVGNWEPVARLTGHEASVWGVLAYDNSTVITASADKYIRVFHISGKLIKRFQASEDVVRALVKLPSNHSSGAQFASAGNDNRIRLWTLEGVFMGELFGHENFVYSLAVLPSGDIVSSSEDRTVRIWSNNTCTQTITHPAISVWSVAVCRQNSDIVTGASDKIVRVFSNAAERQATVEDIQTFEASVQASAIPQQSLGDINKTDLPGPDFLQRKSGTKEGQVQLIKETNGNVTAYQWSSQGQEWVSVGTVVDAAGSASKVTYDGKDYDYVFDVDIEDGKPALKLPYNASESPFEAARKFLERNKLPMSYVDSIVNFISQNTQGTAIGRQESNNAQGGSDPWGTESRYRPGTTSSPASAPSSQPTSVSQSILPQKSYLAISTGSHKMILKKIQEFNDQLRADGRKDLVLTDADVSTLSEAIAKIEPVAGKQEATIKAPAGAITAAIQAVKTWPSDKRLPWLDLLRLLTAASDDTITLAASEGSSLVQQLSEAGVFDESAPDNNVMLAIRTLANLFCSKPGRSLADSSFDQILGLVEPYSMSANKNLSIALTTLYINFAVLLTGSALSSNGAKQDSEKPRDGNGDADRALTLLSALIQILNSTSDPEALYRALVAAGSVLCLGKDFAEVAKDGLDLEAALDRAEQQGKEPRIVKLVQEIKGLLT